MHDKIILEALEIECVIGVFDWERKIKQTVSIDLALSCDMTKAGLTDSIEDAVDYKSISKDIIALVEPSEFQLIETMAAKIAELCLKHDGVSSATVRVSKPGAVRGSKNISVEIRRPTVGTIIYLGVGGNIDPEPNITEGLKLLSKRFDVQKVSPTYKSQAWGVKDKQADYLNLAVKAATDKDVFAVRAELRWIEEIMGRERTLDKFSPRTLDIDLLLFGGLVYEDSGGAIPHKQLTTQQFVYMPMIDIAKDLIVPGVGKALKDIAPEYDEKELKITKITN
ncbi:2-amino-4-hydroxy-6-hydroxymethyldihydropteridinepyrophosphokinase [hydrothermal vent metagenome]|uniref:2-amino-4-hydroxy-6-hydroxymethyldihydropteridine diphosphokinase n=1 Tax=hydrothermal vent metagenome TaxID=652676 RepID=A0A3B1BX74_9ZZZZ